MRIVLRGRRTLLLWLTTCLCVISVSMSALTVAFGSPIPSALQVRMSTPRAAAALRAIDGYQAGERAALRTLDDAVLAQLPVFAQGAALDAVAARVAGLRAAGRYQELTVEAFAVVAITEADPDLYVTTHEVIRVAEVAQGTPGVPVEQSTGAWEVVYHLVHDAGRWRVAAVRAEESGPP